MRGLSVKCLRSIARHGAILLLAAGAGAVLAPPAMAQALVLKSDVASARVDRMLAEGRRVDVPAGRTLVVMLPSGETRSLVGPMKFVVPHAQQSQRDLFAVLREMLQVRRDRYRLGGVRNGDASCAAEPASWSALAGQWRLGCRTEALSALDARLVELGR